MRTKILISALIAFTFTIGTLMANEPMMAPKAISSSVAELINEEISYPEFAINEKFQGDVVIKVVIEEDGTFEVTDANSHNNDMINYVIREVENLDTDNFEKYAGQAVLVKLTFDLKLY
jgi:hypothetical protein